MNCGRKRFVRNKFRPFIIVRRGGDVKSEVAPFVQTADYEFLAGGD
jgi:hypothetical protein